jgi:hypothetical protein
MFVAAGINYVSILGKLRWRSYKRKQADKRYVAEYIKRLELEREARQECLKLSSPYR